MPCPLLKSINHGSWTGSNKINAHLERLFDETNDRIERGNSELVALSALRKAERHYQQRMARALGDDEEIAHLLTLGIRYHDMDLARIVINGWLFMGKRSFELVAQQLQAAE